MSSAPEVVRYSMHGMEAAQPGLEPVLPPKPAYGYWGQSESRICGVRKMTFCLIAILVALSLAVVGIAVGLGVEMNAIHQTRMSTYPFLSTQIFDRQPLLLDCLGHYAHYMLTRHPQSKPHRQ